MTLSELDVGLYYKLMWALQFYVNQELNILDIKTVEEYASVPNREKVDIREALYENVELIDSFVQENPYGLSTEELAIVSKWKSFRNGSFFIERILKNYAIFIQGEEVFGVLGLTDGFDVVTNNATLPLYVDTVLLPFKETIIYDGLMWIKRMTFGGGIKRNLKEIYMRAKQNNRIISSFEQPQAKHQNGPEPGFSKTWTPELEELARKAKKLKGSGDCPAIYTPAFSLVRASIEFAQIAASDPKDRKGLHDALKRVRRACNKTNTVLRREEF